MICRRRALEVAMLVGMAVNAAACRVGSPRTPEALRSAYLDAIENNDPDAAYELLSEQVQSQVDRASFRTHWASHRAELEQTAASIRALDDQASAPVWYGDTLHPSGRVLHWAHVDKAFRVVDGLPAAADLSTPRSAIQALVTALRAAEHGPMTTVMTDELAARVDRRWQDVADALERALDDPRALEISDDGSRAVLIYAEGRHLVLRRIGAQWRVDELE